jgi:hypothetical protein
MKTLYQLVYGDDCTDIDGKGFKITDSNWNEYACGQCCAIMTGDEDICPICGKLNDFNEAIKISAKELKELVEDMHAQEMREAIARFDGKDYT